VELLAQIEALFAEQGERLYDDRRREGVTALQHALQCAQLAEWAHADPPLIAAALLHDIGHFLSPGREIDDLDDAHEVWGLEMLAQGFGADVLEPIRLHVQAKRYLVAVDAGYVSKLSAASVHSLTLQGGPMTSAEMQAFALSPHAAQALQLRRWDDVAKEPGRTTPPLGYFLALLDDVRQRAVIDPNTGIGSFSVP
jgi:phosphonate degradation associated HDIG domain protein